VAIDAAAPAANFLAHHRREQRGPGDFF